MVTSNMEQPEMRRLFTRVRPDWHV